MALMERTIESKEKTIKIMNDTSRKDYKKKLRLDEDIKKLKRIIIMKDKTIESKNITIEELKHKKKKKIKKIHYCKIRKNIINKL